MIASSKGLYIPPSLLKRAPESYAIEKPLLPIFHPLLPLRTIAAESGKARRPGSLISCKIVSPLSKNRARKKPNAFRLA
ncbi:MAG TPA: hypothetical protein DEA63_05155 [Firmicutes bacterium]|nr:hypothetical protein [Bacillota bacterium]